MYMQLPGCVPLGAAWGVVEGEKGAGWGGAPHCHIIITVIIMIMPRRSVLPKQSRAEQSRAEQDGVTERLPSVNAPP